MYGLKYIFANITALETSPQLYFEQGFRRRRRHLVSAINCGIGKRRNS